MITSVFSRDGVEIVEIEVEGVKATGVSTNMVGSQANVLEVRCNRGMMFCKVFDPSTMDERPVPVAIFSAPRFEDMLERVPFYLNPAARELGATEEMTGAELMKLFS